MGKVNTRSSTRDESSSSKTYRMSSRFKDSKICPKFDLCTYVKLPVCSTSLLTPGKVTILGCLSAREPPRSPARLLIHSICPNSDAATLVKSARCSVVLDAWKNSTNRDIQRLPELPERSIGWTATRCTCHTRLWCVRASIIFHERRGWMPWHFTPFFTWPVSSDSTSDGIYYIILTQRSVHNWNPIRTSVHEKY